MNFIQLRNILVQIIALFYFISSITCSVIPPDEARDLNTCVAACTTFRESFYTFTKELNANSWEAAKKDFSTCQYRCYKCTLKPAVHAMEMIDQYNSDFSGEKTKFVILSIQQLRIVEGVQNCKDKWKVAATLNCPKTPIEDAVDLDIKDCIQ